MEIVLETVPATAEEKNHVVFSAADNHTDIKNSIQRLTHRRQDERLLP